MHYTTAFQEFLISPHPSTEFTAAIVKKLIQALDEDRTHFMELMDSLVSVKQEVSSLRSDVNVGFQEISSKFDKLDTSMTGVKQEVASLKQEMTNVKQEITIGFTQTHQILLNLDKRLEQIVHNTNRDAP